MRSLFAEAGLRAQISMVAPDPSGRGEPIGGMTIGSSLHDGEYFRAIAGKEAMLLSAAMLYHNSTIGEIRRSAEHTSALQSLMRISYAVFISNKNQQH